MQFRYFGKDKTIVSEVGLGTWQLGGDWGTVDDAAAEKIDEAAEAAAAAGAQFDPKSMQAEALRRIADQIDSVAARVRDADLDSIVGDVSNFARRNPLLFIGAAAAVGFAATSEAGWLSESSLRNRFKRANAQIIIAGFQPDGEIVCKM